MKLWLETFIILIQLHNPTTEIMLPFVGKSREKTDGVKPCSAKASDTKLIFAAGNVFSM